jgi:hypothetical protein
MVLLSATPKIAALIATMFLKLLVFFRSKSKLLSSGSTAMMRALGYFFAKKIALVSILIDHTSFFIKLKPHPV